MDQVLLILRAPVMDCVRQDITVLPGQQVLPLITVAPTVIVSKDQQHNVTPLVQQTLLLPLHLMPSTIVMVMEDGTTVTMEPVISPLPDTILQLTTILSISVGVITLILLREQVVALR